MNRRLYRPASALFPLACLSGILTAGASLVESYFFLFIYVSLFSLSADGAFRNVAARQGTLRRLDRCFFGAALPVMLAFVCTWIALILMRRLPDHGVWVIAAGAFTIIEHLFEERSYALSRPMDACIMSLVNALCLSLGFAFDAQLPARGMGVAAGALLGAAISALTSFTITSAKGFSLQPVIYQCAGRAVPQDLLFPVAAIFVRRYIPGEGAIIAILAGMILWRGVRTVYRRAADESAPMNLWIMVFSALGCVAWMFFPRLECVGIYLALAMLCAVILFAHPSVRVYAGAACVCAAAVLLRLNIYPDYARYAVCALCAAAILLNLRHAFLKRVS